MQKYADEVGDIHNKCCKRYEALAVKSSHRARFVSCGRCNEDRQTISKIKRTMEKTRNVMLRNDLYRTRGACCVKYVCTDGYEAFWCSIMFANCYEVVSNVMAVRGSENMTIRATTIWTDCIGRMNMYGSQHVGEAA